MARNAAQLVLPFSVHKSGTHISRFYRRALQLSIGLTLALSTTAITSFVLTNRHSSWRLASLTAAVLALASTALWSVAINHYRACRLTEVRELTMQPEPDLAEQAQVYCEKRRATRFASFWLAVIAASAVALIGAGTALLVTLALDLGAKVPLGMACYGSVVIGAASVYRRVSALKFSASLNKFM